MTITATTSVGALVGVANLAGVPLPASVALQRDVVRYVDEILADQMPELDITGATSPEEIEKAITARARTIARASALRELAAQIPLLQARLAGAVRAAVPQIAEAITPRFDAAVESLKDAARRLPAGDDVLDPAKILDTRAGDAYEAAQDALTLIRSVAVLWAANDSTPRHVPVHLARLTDVLRIDDAEPYRITPGEWGRQPFPDVDQPATNAALYDLDRRMTGRAFGSDAEPWTHERTLIEIARRDWAGLTLELATGPEEIARRNAQLVDAFARSQEFVPDAARA